MWISLSLQRVGELLDTTPCFTDDAGSPGVPDRRSRQRVR